MHTKVVKQMRQRTKPLPCLRIPNPPAYTIVKADTSDRGYGGIL